MKKIGEGYRKTTRIIHGAARSAKWDFAHHVVPPLTSSTTYRLESVRRGARGFAEYGQLPEDPSEPPVYIYDRLGEPTRGLLESELADMEGAEACATFASGMAAIAAGLGAVLRSGDEIVAHTLLYGCTHSLFTRWFPRLGIKVTRVDFTDARALAAAVNSKTRVLYYESPVNPTLDLIDVRAVSALCAAANRSRKNGKKLYSIIDNTFATPFCQRPLEMGADMVVYSLTKNIGGFGTEVGGAVLCSKELYPEVMSYRKDFGGILGPKSAWAILVYGVPTLPLRIKRQQYSAMIVARSLEKNPLVKEVRYPGLPSFPNYSLARTQLRDFDGEFAPGNMIYFRVKEEAVDPVAFLDNLAANAYSVTLAVSLGHVKTLIEMPSQMTHSAYEASGPMREPGGLRLSIGLESPMDILKDLESAFLATARPEGASQLRR